MVSPEGFLSSTTAEEKAKKVIQENFTLLPPAPSFDNGLYCCKADGTLRKNEAVGQDAESKTPDPTPSPSKTPSSTPSTSPSESPSTSLEI
ncbi:MAG: hypothetical protein AAGA18_16100 [Verrucomicrobiota bacterium]